MPITLPKGGNISLSSEEHSDGKLAVALGFSAGPGLQSPIDVDASAFLLGEDGKVRRGADFIFYNQPSDEESRFICLLENASGQSANSSSPEEPDADHVRFSIDLEAIPTDIQRIVFCLTLHGAEERRQNFGCIKKLYLRVLNRTQNLETVRFEAVGEFSTETALQVSELYRRGDSWKLRAIGQGFAGGLAALATDFGVHLEMATDTDEQPPARQDDANETANFEVVPPSISSGKAPPSLTDEFHPDLPSLSKKKRRSSSEILAAQTEEIARAMKPFLPQIGLTLRNAANESSTRILLDRILQQVLGYSLEEIKPEHKIQGRTADYVLSPGGIDSVVIEVKRIGAPLKQKQIFQATSYAAYSGIKWALLTNLITWKLYRVSTTDKIEPHLVFTIDLNKGLSEDAAHYLTLISKNGIVRKTPLERLWQIRRSLSTESLIGAILHDDVLSRIRTLIARDTGINLDTADIKAALEQDILKIE